MSLESIHKALEAKGKPCGRTTGHGESCVRGWECGACSDKAKLIKALRVAVGQLNIHAGRDFDREYQGDEEDAGKALAEISSLLSEGSHAD